VALDCEPEIWQIAALKPSEKTKNDANKEHLIKPPRRDQYYRESHKETFIPSIIEIMCWARFIIRNGHIVHKSAFYIDEMTIGEDKITLITKCSGCSVTC